MSSKKQHKQQVFVVDEDLGKTFFKVLKESGCCTVHLFEEFWPSGTEDPVWIPYTAQSNLIVITHDKRIRLQHRDIVLREGARIISVGSARRPTEIAEWFVRSWPKIERFVRKNDAPYFAKFNLPTAKEQQKLKPMGKITLQKP